MSTINLIHQTDVDAPAALAWRIVADYSRDVEWRAECVGWCRARWAWCRSAPPPPRR